MEALGDGDVRLVFLVEELDYCCYVVEQYTEEDIECLEEDSGLAVRLPVPIGERVFLEGPQAGIQVCKDHRQVVGIVVEGFECSRKSPAIRAGIVWPQHPDHVQPVTEVCGQVVLVARGD